MFIINFGAAMEEIVKEFLAPHLKESIFVVLTIVLIYLMRKDSKDNSDKYLETVHQMFDVVNRNTESHMKNSDSNAKLTEAMTDLKDEIRNKR